MNPHKLWMYYRQGYAFYLAMILGAMNTLILVYFTMGDKIFLIRDTFPHFAIFIAFAVCVGVPTLMLIGWLHTKRAFKNEVEVTTKENPFHYRLPAGHSIEVLYPILYEILLQLEKQNPERYSQYQELRKKLSVLLAGGSVGK